MSRTLLIGDEISLPTDASAATTLNGATVVRVVNSSTSAATLSLELDEVGATPITVTILSKTVEMIEKKSYQVIFCSGSLKGSQVGFTD